VRRGGGNESAGRLPLLSHLKGGVRRGGGGREERGRSKHVLVLHAAIVFTPSLFLISPFCCRLLR
jgi:hypothetical protein